MKHMIVKSLLSIAAVSFLLSSKSFALDDDPTNRKIIPAVSFSDTGKTMARFLSGNMVGLLAHHLGFIVTAREYSLNYIPGLKTVTYELSLLDVLRRTKEPTRNANDPNDRWNVIYRSGNKAELILGMIPLHKYRHKERLINEYGVKAVVSMLENFELAPGWFNTPVSAQEWAASGVAHHLVVAADFNPLSITTIAMAVQHIKNYLEKGQSVYVHCKAGVGRSATVAAAYEVQEKYRKARGYNVPDDETITKDIDNIVDQMLQIRKVNLREAQRKAIFDYVKSLK